MRQKWKRSVKSSTICQSTADSISVNNSNGPKNVISRPIFQSAIQNHFNHLRLPHRRFVIFHCFIVIHEEIYSLPYVRTDFLQIQHLGSTQKVSIKSAHFLKNQCCQHLLNWNEVELVTLRFWVEMSKRWENEIWVKSSKTNHPERFSQHVKLLHWLLDDSTVFLL